ncbi:hypothetical protein BPT24_217 [Tenacibaculum phage pT24]|uniref:Uncharacterized protein n=1 Tax=Tenacibaculum phage pT24 TaxID=1880590 RepID=A0A1B4XX07_9CAUD|nr:hypothetical protein HYP10_gp217 [Tenacibaculum phage pT24]BAV39341.1 hypothetical protein BPT24_217 [Tenacibaculum phage pT24]
MNNLDHIVPEILANSISKVLTRNTKIRPFRVLIFKDDITEFHIKKYDYTIVLASMDYKEFKSGIGFFGNQDFDRQAMKLNKTPENYYETFRKESCLQIALSVSNKIEDILTSIFSTSIDIDTIKGTENILTNCVLKGENLTPHIVIGVELSDIKSPESVLIVH